MRPQAMKAEPWEIEANGWYAENPLHYVIDELQAAPDQFQIPILEAIGRGENVVVRSGHGVGKTAILAWIGLWFLDCQVDPRVVATAPTEAQLKNVLWIEAYKWLARSSRPRHFAWTKEKIFLRGFEQTAWWIMRTATNPTALQGLHADDLSDGRLLLMADEAPGIPDANFEAFEGVLTSENAQVVITGNPTRTNGEFYDAFHLNKSLWSGFKISAENHPRVSTQYVERQRRKWGADSDVFRARVLGDFPTGDPNTLITLASIEAAIFRRPDPGGELQIGVDVARYGDDRTVIYGREGMRVFKPEIFAHTSMPEVSGHTIRYAAMMRRELDRPNDSITVAVDVSGVGGGAVDILELEAPAKNLIIVPCNFGGAGDDEYDDFASVMWGAVRDCAEFLSLPQCDEIDDTIGELTTRKYSIAKNGKIKIEAKDIYKKRIGWSPDLADGLVLAFAPDMRPTIRITSI